MLKLSAHSGPRRRFENRPRHRPWLAWRGPALTGSSSGETLDVVNPATETVLSSISAGSTNQRPSGLQRSLCVLKTSVEVGHVLEGLAYERFGYIAGLGNISSDDNEPGIVVLHGQSSIVLRPFHIP